MYYLCSVDGCSSVRQEVYLHHIPVRNEERLKKWLRCLGSKFKCLSLDELKNHYVCHKHFENRFITPKNRLLAAAYPTLFTNEEITTGIPSASLHFEVTENENPHEEHNYSRKRHLDHNYCKPVSSVLHEIPVKRIMSTLNVQEQKPALSTAAMENPGSSMLKLNAPIGEPQASTSSAMENPGLSMLTLNAPIREPQASTSSGYKPPLNVTNKHRRRRPVQKLSALSPRCKNIYKEYLNAKRQLNRTKTLKRALKFTKEKTLEKLTKSMNPYAKILFGMQIKMSCKKQKGRRFTMKEKLISLSIMKQSPKAYRFLHKIFILPSKTTLNKFVSKLNVGVGINPQIFSVMKEQITTWNEMKKYCTIIFDEMSLTPALHFNKDKDQITGFVEIPERSNQFADHVLVFLLRGAVYKWQQPAAYYFCEGATSGIQLKNILRNIVAAVSNTGLIPLALVCDQGSAFQSALNSLKQETRREQIIAGTNLDEMVTVNSIPMCVIYDPCHLIKGLRNNFLTKNIVFNENIATWQDIIDVYKTDCSHAEIRLLHKLNDEHVMPDKIKKMKVKNCVRVLSKTMAAALSYTAQFSHYIDGKPVSKTLKNTAEIISFCDDLFDSVNGAAVFCKKAKGKELRTAVTDKSKHYRFWSEAIQKLERIKFIDKNGKKVSVPTLRNWVTTLKSFMKLWQILKEKNIKIMRPRQFNSDPIENFFGQVRAYNYRNVNPNCHNFSCTFKSLLLTRFLNFHSETFNCEDDMAKDLLKLEKMFNCLTNDNESVDESNVPQHHTLMNSDSIEDAARRERLNVHSRAYTAGWVLKKVFNKVKVCDECKERLMSTEVKTIHNWVSAREYKAATHKLAYPSEELVRAYGNIVKETNEYLEENGHKKNLVKNLKQILLSKYPFDFLNCQAHRESVINSFMDISITLQVYNWCNIINKILMGTDISRLNERNLPKLQAKALLKYKKKLKIKSITK